MEHAIVGIVTNETENSSKNVISAWNHVLTNLTRRNVWLWQQDPIISILIFRPFVSKPYVSLNDSNCHLFLGSPFNFLTIIGTTLFKEFTYLDRILFQNGCLFYLLSVFVLFSVVVNPIISSAIIQTALIRVCDGLCFIISLRNIDFIRLLIYSSLVSLFKISSIIK